MLRAGAERTSAAIANSWTRNDAISKSSFFEVEPPTRSGGSGSQDRPWRYVLVNRRVRRAGVEMKARPSFRKNNFR